MGQFWYNVGITLGTNLGPHVHYLKGNFGLKECPPQGGPLGPRGPWGPLGPRGVPRGPRGAAPMVIYWHFFKLSENYRYRKNNIWELAKNYRYQKKCNQFHPICSKEQKRECFISQTNIKSSLKTVHKVVRHYSKNILDCKRCSFLP